MDDVLRLKALRPSLLDDAAHFFLTAADLRLRALDPASLCAAALFWN